MQWRRSRATEEVGRTNRRRRRRRRLGESGAQVAFLEASSCFVEGFNKGPFVDEGILFLVGELEKIKRVQPV